MQIKIFITYVLVLLYLNSHADVNIKGKIINAAQNTSIKISYYTDPFYINEVLLAQTYTDSLGKFEMKFKLKNDEFAYLQIRNSLFQIHIKTDDYIEITANENDLLETIKISGKNAADNIFLLEQQKLELNTIAFSQQHLLSEKEYLKLIDSLEIQGKEFFINYDKKNISKKVQDYLKYNSIYGLHNARWMYTIKYDPQKAKIVNREVGPDYFKYLDNMDLEDQAAIEFPDYRIAIMRYDYEKIGKNISKTISINLNEQETQKQMFIKSYDAKKKLYKGNILNYVLTDHVKNRYNSIKSNVIFCDSILTDYNQLCTNETYKLALKNYIDNSNKLSKGTSVPDIKLKDIKGNDVSLSQFKGKLIYIDFWATWCAPCLVNMPDSKKLMEEFKEVTFLYINIDDNRKNWEKYLKDKNEIKSNHLYANELTTTEIYKLFNFKSIPHYILIDKDFNFYDSNATVPSQVKRDLISLINLK